jgi:hypothetical protein
MLLKADLGKASDVMVWVDSREACDHVAFNHRDECAGNEPAEAA